MSAVERFRAFPQHLWAPTSRFGHIAGYVVPDSLQQQEEQTTRVVSEPDYTEWDVVGDSQDQVDAAASSSHEDSGCVYVSSGDVNILCEVLNARAPVFDNIADIPSSVPLYARGQVAVWMEMNSVNQPVIRVESPVSPAAFLTLHALWRIIGLDYGYVAGNLMRSEVPDFVPIQSPARRMASIIGYGSWECMENSACDSVRHLRRPLESLGQTARYLYTMFDRIGSLGAMQSIVNSNRPAFEQRQLYMEEFTLRYSPNKQSMDLVFHSSVVRKHLMQRIWYYMNQQMRVVFETLSLTAMMYMEMRVALVIDRGLSIRVQARIRRIEDGVRRISAMLENPRELVCKFVDDERRAMDAEDKMMIGTLLVNVIEKTIRPAFDMVHDALQRVIAVFKEGFFLEENPGGDWGTNVPGALQVFLLAPLASTSTRAYYFGRRNEECKEEDWSNMLTIDELFMLYFELGAVYGATILTIERLEIARSVNRNYLREFHVYLNAFHDVEKVPPGDRHLYLNGLYEQFHRLQDMHYIRDRPIRSVYTGSAGSGAAAAAGSSAAAAGSAAAAAAGFRPRLRDATLRFWQEHTDKYPHGFMKANMPTMQEDRENDGCERLQRTRNRDVDVDWSNDEVYLRRGREKRRAVQ